MSRRCISAARAGRRRLAATRPARALAGALLIAAVCAGPACRGGRAPASGASSPLSSSLSLSALLADAPGADVARTGRAGENADFARALVPRPFVFPDDDGPHADFRSEWWYFTGVLRTASAGGVRARRFGYEMTIFREALVPRRAARASAWSTRDAFMGHFAITDVDGGDLGDRRFHAYDRFARDGLGLAGARARPFAVWVDDWRMEGPPGGVGPLPIHLSARDADGAAIDLTVTGEDRGQDREQDRESSRPIAEGDRGLSSKGPAPGNASFYYSRPSLATRGRLTLPGASFDVAGVSWMDREWGTGALGADVRGWDWLGVHLSDGRDLMMYRLRDPQGHATADSRVAVMPSRPAAGEARAIPYQRFTLTPIDTWQSPQTGARYPVSFQLEVPEAGIDLVVRPLLVDQEMRLAVVYWEGAVSLAGTAAGAPITGEGYLELTGYGGGQRQR
jgi:predicted secreted hydrolase